MSTRAQLGSVSRSHRDAARNRRVLQVAKIVAGTLGADFFHSVVKHLAAVFHADCVYVGELTDGPAERIRTLAVSGKRHTIDLFDQGLSGSAAGQVMADGAYACGKGVLRVFPEDDRLQKIGADGYAGVRLSDGDGQPIGLLAVVCRRPVADTQLVKSVLEAFAPRTAAELARKRTADYHRENEERYHAFVTTNPDAMWRIEFEQPVALNLPEDEQFEQIYRFGYLAECNEALAELAGRSVAQLTGSRLDEIAPQTDPVVVEEMRTAIRSGFRATSTETTVQDANGRQRYRLRSQFGIVEDAKLQRLWGTTRDITDLKRAERSVAASERRFREVLEGVHLLAVILNPQGFITFCNDSFVELTRRSRNALDLVYWLDGVIPAAETQVWKAAMVSDQDRQEATTHFDGVIVPLGGEPRTVRWDTTCLRGQDGELIALAAIGRDLTHQNALETQIREVQKLDGIGRLAAGVAHDFNNLLTVILGHAGMLQQQLPEDDSRHPSVSEIEHAARQCARLAGQLIAFGRGQLLKPEPLNLNDVIAAEEGIIRTIAGERIELVFELARPCGIVYADPMQIQRVLVNLVTNARDAMPEGGRLIIATSDVKVTDEDARYPAIHAGSYVCMSVTDSGVGLSEEVRAHIFEPLFTTKEPGKGNGLGLATVYGIVTQSGGHIAVRSEPGKGATFDILLPTSPK